MVNPLLRAATLPYGLPDFAGIESQHYEAAILAEITSAQESLNGIVTNPEPPSVENTLEALERTERPLRRVFSVFHQVLWADGSPEFDQINLRVGPKVAAAQDEMLMNKPLYDRITQLGNLLAAHPELGSENHAATLFLIEHLLKRMRLAGVELNVSEQVRLRKINAKLTELSAEFGRLLVAGNKNAAVLVTDKNELAGLDADTVAAYASAAQAQGQTGWLIGLELPTQQPILSTAQNRELRAKIQTAAESRGAVGDANNTSKLITEIAKLRTEKAQILGFPNYVAYVADDAVIKTPEAITELLERLAEPALANVISETKQLAKIAGESAPNGQTLNGQTLNEPAPSGQLSNNQHPNNQAPNKQVAASDWALLAEKYRQQEYNFDFDRLRPYLELESVLHNGVFAAAQALYGLEFIPRPDLIGYHSDVRIFEVFDDDKQKIPNHGRGLILFDFYARPNKRGGAWMNGIIEQSRMLNQKPVVTQTLNIVKPAANEPTLLTWSNVKTLFHEFGHALHGLLSDVYYPSQAGTQVPRDFVEYPSQVNEMWMYNPALRNQYARHYQNQQPIPEQWLEHLQQTKSFGEGFALVEMLGANAIDQAWHRLAPGNVPTPEQVSEFETQALKAAGVHFPPVPPRYRSTYFNHIWSGGYAAAYYSYLLSQMYDADTVTWFSENGGLTRENGQKFAQEVLSRGFSRDPQESFHALRGRDVTIEPLLKRRGLTTGGGRKSVYEPSN